MPAIEALAVADAVTTSKVGFQQIIDGVSDKTAALSTQRDALIAQDRAIRQQIVDLNNQIEALEGPEVAKARQAQKLLDMLNDPRQATRLRQAGIF